MILKVIDYFPWLLITKKFSKFLITCVAKIISIMIPIFLYLFTVKRMAQLFCMFCKKQKKYKARESQSHNNLTKEKTTNRKRNENLKKSRKDRTNYIEEQNNVRAFTQ